MAGYTRQDEGNISNGNIIDATDLNAEFDKLQTAFASSGGHTHDGTSDGGARIEVVGPNGEVTVGASAVTPKVSTDVDVGTASLKFNNANFKGTVSAPTFTATNGATIPSLTVGSSTAVTSVDADLSSVSTNHDTLASAKAIKTYIDSQVTAQDLDITDGTTTGSIDLDSQTLTFTGSTGITASVSGQTVTIATDDSAIAHGSLSGFVSEEHVDHSDVSITAGNGLTGGGTIEATRDLAVGAGTGIAVNADDVALSHLGLEDLTDPDADRVAFWDDSAGAFKWLEMGSNLAIDGTTLNATDTNTDTTYTTATTSTLGLVKLGDDTEQTVAANSVTATASRSYAVQLDSSDQMVVNVPWVDTNTDTTYSTATSSSLGLVKLGSDTEQTTAAQTVTSTASRTYAVQLNGSDQMVVNVPWVDTNTDTNTTYTAGTGLTLDGTTFNANVDATTQTVASETVSATASRTYAVQVDSSDNLVVNVPWLEGEATSTSDYTIEADGQIRFKSENSLSLSSLPTITNGDFETSGPETYGPTNDDTGTWYGFTSSGSGIAWSRYQKPGSGNYVARLYKTSSDDVISGVNLWYENDFTFLAGVTYTISFKLYTASYLTGTGTTEDIRLLIGNGAGGSEVYQGDWITSSDHTGVGGITTFTRSFTPTETGKYEITFNVGQDTGSSTWAIGVDDVTVSAAAYDGNPKFYFQHPTEDSVTNDARVDVHIFNTDDATSDLQTIGNIHFTAKDSASIEQNFATISSSIVDNTSGTLDGQLEFIVKSLRFGADTTTVFDANGAGDTSVRGRNNVKIYGTTTTLSATFNGANLDVEGALSKGSGSFKIDHPLPAKTETHHLVHSFIEGPQADLIYRGRAELVDGTATVNIDTAAGMTEGTFVVLCGDVQCFTSNETGWTAVKGSVSGNTLTITAQDNTCTDTISWMVVGERKDQHMIDTDWTDDEGHVIVEPAKQ